MRWIFPLVAAVAVLMCGPGPAAAEDSVSSFTGETASGSVPGAAPQTPERTLVLMKKACDKGGLVACSDLGLVYLEGRGVDRDAARALGLFRRSCENGEARGCANLGLVYERGEPQLKIARDEAKAMAMYRRSCAVHGAGGCERVGLAYLNGQLGLTQETAQAAGFFDLACTAGSAASCTRLGTLYQNGQGVPVDRGQADTLYRRGCLGGDLQGCSNLAGRLAESSGAANVPPELLRQIEATCQSGAIEGACANLAAMFQLGRGVRRDLRRSAALYEATCRRGQATSCLGLGLQSVALLRTACEHGATLGCTTLGAMYAQGRGVPRSDAKALPLFARACESGEAGGCFSAGMLALTGRGIAASVAEAVRHFDRGCRLGHAEACARLMLCQGSDLKSCTEPLQGLSHRDPQ